MHLLSVVDPRSGTETITQALATAPADMHTAIKITCMVYTEQPQLLLNAVNLYSQVAAPRKNQSKQASLTDLMFPLP